MSLEDLGQGRDTRAFASETVRSQLKIYRQMKPLNNSYHLLLGSPLQAKDIWL